MAANKEPDPVFYARSDFFVSLVDRETAESALRTHCSVQFCYVLRPFDDGQWSTDKVTATVYRNSALPARVGARLFGFAHRTFRWDSGRGEWTLYLGGKPRLNAMRSSRYTSDGTIDSFLEQWLGPGFQSHVLQFLRPAEATQLREERPAAPLSCDSCLRGSRSGFGLRGSARACACCNLHCKEALLECRSEAPCDVRAEETGARDPSTACFDTETELLFTEDSLRPGGASMAMAHRSLAVCEPDPPVKQRLHRRAIELTPRHRQLSPHQARTMLVIAHCSEPLDWLGPFKDVPLTVYEKCQAGRPPCPTPLEPLRYAVYPNGGPFRMNSTVRITKDLCNTGEEAQGFLRFIVDYYDELPDFTFFLQGGPMRHSPFLHEVLPKIKIDHLDFVSLSNLYIGYNVTGEPNSPMHDPAKLPMLAHYIPRWFGFAAPNLMGCYCCGMFGVSQRAIRARPLLFWRTLLAVADGRVPSYRDGDQRRRLEAGLFERTWHLIFGEDPLQRTYLKKARTWNHWGLHGYLNHLSGAEYDNSTKL